MNIFTKARLRCIAWYDKKTDQFRPASYRHPNGLVDDFVVSGFVDHELSGYEADRSRALFKKRRIFLLRSEGGRIVYPCLKTFDSMMYTLDDRINVIQTRIRAHFVAYNVDAQELERQKQHYSKDGALEYEYLYEEMLQKRQKKLLAKVQPMYLAIIELLERKIKRIGLMGSRLEMLRTKRFERINQYYLYASDDPKLPKIYYSYDRMGMIADISTIEAYEPQQENAKKTAAAYHEEYGKLFRVSK